MVHQINTLYDDYENPRYVYDNLITNKNFSKGIGVNDANVEIIMRVAKKLKMKKKKFIF